MSARILALLEHPEPLKKVIASLEPFGHEVFPASNFHDAMEILRHRDADLIIADVHLQNGGSVFDFMRWVKGDPHMKAIPFVCFSSEPVEVPKYLADGVRMAARAMGAVKYMTMEKFDPIQFRNEIEWLLPIKNAGNAYADVIDPNNGHDGKFQIEAVKN